MDRSAYTPDVTVPRVSIEAGVTTGWSGLVDLAVGIDEFGASGPGDEVMAHYGLAPGLIADKVLTLLADRRET